jgi:hypothetical protein
MSSPQILNFNFGASTVISAIADCPFGFHRCRPTATERPTAFFLPVQPNCPFDRSRPTLLLFTFASAKVSVGAVEKSAFQVMT